MFLHVSVILFTGVSVSVPGGVSIPGGVSVLGGLCHGDSPHTVMNRRYASYWNAFLLLKFQPGFPLVSFGFSVVILTTNTVFVVLLEICITGCNLISKLCARM